MIYIVNFPFCNFHSIQRYFIAKNLEFCILEHNTTFNRNDIVVLPGVGTFKEGSTYLQQTGLYDSIRDHSLAGGFLLGICLGMQLLLSSSDESIGFHGLNIFPGNCLRIPSTPNFRVPHIGWNSLSIQKKALQRYNSYAIVDDLLATGGTASCVSKLIESNEKEVVGMLVVVELINLKGRLKLSYPIESIISL